MRKLWKGLRWGAFFFALVVDGLLFTSADPFSTRSFVATGLASLLMFLVFARLASLMRGRSRIRRVLEDGERRMHETGVHWIQLLRNIRSDKTAYRWIGIPVLISAAVTLFELLWLLSRVAASAGIVAPWFDHATVIFRILPDNAALIGGYTSLVFAIPFAISHVAEWSTHRYVITPLRIIIHHGIFDYHIHGILLSRVIDAKQDYSFWQQLLGYGDVVFRETSGADETLACVWGPKKFAKIATHYSHAAESQSGGHGAPAAATTE